MLVIQNPMIVKAKGGPPGDKKRFESCRTISAGYGGNKEVGRKQKAVSRKQ
jgi:hypothetical protein